MTSPTVTATSPELVGGTPNWAGSPVESTRSTFQSLRTTTEPSVVWNAPWPRPCSSRALPNVPARPSKYSLVSVQLDSSYTESTIEPEG